MFHNDSSVLTKYWAEFGETLKIRLSKEVSVFEKRSDLKIATWLRGTLSDPPGCQPSHSIKESTKWCVKPTSHFTTPRQAHHQYSATHICISSEKQNSKSFQATPALLGKPQKLATGRNEDSSFFSVQTGSDTRGWANCSPAMLTTISAEKDHPVMRQFRFLTGALLTIPQNSQPQTT